MLARSIRRIVATATSASHRLVFARHNRTATAQQVAAARNPELGARPPSAAFAQLQNKVLERADAFADDKGALSDACAALRAELDHYAKSATNAPHKNALTGTRLWANVPLSFASTKSNAQLASKSVPNSSAASLLSFVPPAMASSNNNSSSNRHNSANNSLASSPASFSASAATAARWMATQPNEIPRAACQLFPAYDSAAATMAYFMSLRTLPSPLSAALLPRVFALDAVRELFGDDALHMHEVAVRTVVHYRDRTAVSAAEQPASFVKLARDVAVEGLFTVVINVGAPADLDLVLLRSGAAAHTSPSALAALEPLLNAHPTPAQTPQTQTLTGASQAIADADAASPIAERRTIRMPSGAMCVLTAGEGKWLHRSRPVSEGGASTTIVMGLQHRNK